MRAGFHEVHIDLQGLQHLRILLGTRQGRKSTAAMFFRMRLLRTVSERRKGDGIIYYVPSPTMTSFLRIYSAERLSTARSCCGQTQHTGVWELITAAQE